MMDSLDRALHVLKLANNQYLMDVFFQERNLLCGSLHMRGEVCGYSPSQGPGRCVEARDHQRAPLRDSPGTQRIPERQRKPSFSLHSSRWRDQGLQSDPWPHADSSKL